MAINYATDYTFDDLIDNSFTIVDFYSTTCVPCKMYARILEDISLELPFINIVKTNVSEYPALGNRFNIEAVPTVIIMVHGKEVDREVGLLSEDETLEKIKSFYYGVRI